MKKLIVLLAILNSSWAFAGIPVDQIKSSCSGLLKVIDTSNPEYSPGVPPHGRFNGIPPHAGFAATVEFQPTTSACNAFLSKYQLDFLSSQFKVSVGVPAVSLQTTKQYATQLPGKEVKVEWTQILPYVSGDILPFYPTFHVETLTLSGDLDQTFTIGAYFPVDTQKTYGVPSLENLTDNEKLQLEKDIISFQLAYVKQPGWNVPFISLLTSIEPNSRSHKVAYLSKLISLFQSLDPDRTGGGFFFEFYVGGSAGQPIASKINTLAANLKSLTTAELQQLSFQFPSLLVIGFSDVSENACLPVDSDILKANLKAWTSSDLNYQQRNGALAVSSFFTGHPTTFQFCLNKFQDDAEIVNLSTLLYQKLSH